MPLFIIGLLTWSLFEYVLHFLAHHIRPAVHLEGHHKYPEDFNLGPPSWGTVAALAVIMWAVCSAFGGLAFAAGYTIGYAFFALVHYVCHSQLALESKWIRALRRNHNVHHWHGVECNFGVSSPLWDHVFCTFK